MSDRRTITIGLIGKIVTGSTPSPAFAHYWDGEVPFITPADISNSAFVQSTERRLTRLGASLARLIPANSVVVTCIGSTIGKTAYTLVESVTNQQINTIIPCESANARFLYYTLLGLADSIKQIAGVTAVPIVNKSDFSRIELSLPPLPQQRKIARILTTLDNLIEKTESLIAKYQAIKQGMMHDLFTRGIDAHGHLRPPQTEAPDLYKQSELGWIPEMWSIQPLGDVAEIGGGVTLGRALPNTQTTELPYLRVANVQDGYLDLNEIKTVAVLKSEVDRFSLWPGDMLMTEGGDFDKLGRGTVWRGQISPCLHQNHIFRVRPKRDAILPDFLAAVTASSHGKRYFLVSSKQTTNLATINSTQLKAFPVPLPTLGEQGIIVARLAGIERQIEIESRSLKKMRDEKTGLMQDLLTGKVRVQPDDAEAEP